MQKTRSKLAVGRETIRTLQSSELRDIAGGGTTTGGTVTLSEAAEPTNTAHNPTSKAQPISVLTE